MEKKQSLSQPTGVIKLSIFKHENEIEAIYIKFKDGEVSKSREIGPHGEAVVDTDKKGNLLGIEMLEPAHITLSVFKKIKKEFDNPELNKINFEYLQKAFA